MKINKFIILLLLSTAVLLIGCNSKIIDSSEKILSPTNNQIPFSGSWEVKSYKTLPETVTNSSYDPQKLIGTKVESSNDILIFGTEICKNPKYKIKTVNSNDYFLYNYKTNIQDLSITNDKISIISVTSNDTLFYDFIKINTDTLIVKIDNFLFYLKKLSDKTSNLDKATLSNSEHKNNQLPPKDELLRSGILLGLRYTNNNSLNPNTYLENENTYRTLWISSLNKEITPILSCTDLLVPRISGFWKLGINRELSKKNVKDILFAFPLDSNTKSNIMERNLNTHNENILRNILFIGNDYVFTEYTTFLSTEKNNVSTQSNTSPSLNKLQVLPIDNLVNNSGIKISDITGEAYKNSLFESSTSFLSSQSKANQEVLEAKPDEKNFYMSRRNGHWMLKGRLNNLNNKDFQDFNINLIPPKKIINYDELHVSWNDVKSKVPDAADVFTSPNKDLALIISKNYIYIYALNSKILSDKPLSKIKIKDGESVVMAEWATGSYVERWEKAVINNGGTDIMK